MTQTLCAIIYLCSYFSSATIFTPPDSSISTTTTCITPVFIFTHHIKSNKSTTSCFATRPVTPTCQDWLSDDFCIHGNFPSGDFWLYVNLSHYGNWCFYDYIRLIIQQTVVTMVICVGDSICLHRCIIGNYGNLCFYGYIRLIIGHYGNFTW